VVVTLHGQDAGMAIGTNYSTSVMVNGFLCKNCTDVDNAKKHIDPAHPRSGPYGIDAKDDAVDGAHSAASECHRVVALKQTTLRGAVHGRGYHDWS
jgi:hypothetical protein